MVRHENGIVQGGHKTRDIFLNGMVSIIVIWPGGNINALLFTNVLPKKLIPMNKMTSNGYFLC